MYRGNGSLFAKILAVRTKQHIPLLGYNGRIEGGDGGIIRMSSSMLDKWAPKTACDDGRIISYEKYYTIRTFMDDQEGRHED